MGKDHNQDAARTSERSNGGHRRAAVSTTIANERRVAVQGSSDDVHHIPMSADSAAQCLVVMYHYVRPRDETLGGGVRGITPAEFETQLRALTAEWEPIDWPTLYAGMNNRLSLPQRSFLLTFDDGLRDHAENVLPILERWGVRGTFFVPGVVMTKTNLLPAHAAHIALGVLGDEKFEAALRAHAARCGTDLSPLSDDQIRQALRIYHYEPEARARIKYAINFRLEPAQRIQVIDALFESDVGDRLEWARRWYLRWADLTDMQASGHTVGGHGFLHEPYSIMSPVDVMVDARRSAHLLREGLGCDRRPFSYPFGRYDDAIAASVFDAGFVQAFTTQHAWALPTDDGMRMPRVDAVDVAQFTGGAD